MIIILTGSTHTGKTNLAQKLLEHYHFPYLSIDHIKMGLIRSGNTTIQVDEDEALTSYLWPIVKEIIKTAVENQQNLIVEGCYIPFDYKDSFDDNYLIHIRFLCLVMSETYIREHVDDILAYANVVEQRMDTELSMNELIKDNLYTLHQCKLHKCPYVYIDDTYDFMKTVYKFL